MRFLFEGDHETLRSVINPLGYGRMEYNVTDGSMLLVHLDCSHPSAVLHVAGLPNVTMLPHSESLLKDAHVNKLDKFGVKKGDTLNAALDKLHAQFGGHLMDTGLPIT